MNSADKIAALNQQIDKLEAELLSLEIVNHDLKQQVKHYDFDRYKLLEIQRLAKAGTWELNHLTYTVAISDELSLLLCDKPTQMGGIAWHDFLDMIVAAEDNNIKKHLLKMSSKTARVLTWNIT